MFRGRELTEEEALEASKRQQAEPSGLQRASTLEAIKRIMAAGPQAEPAPPPEPINAPPMLERPVGSIPEALGRPGGEVVHPRDRALIEGFKRRDPAHQQRMRTPVRQRETVAAILAKLHPDRHMGATEEQILERFGGWQNFNKWRASLPEQWRPNDYTQASAVADRLGIPRKAEPPRASRQERIDAHMATVPGVRQVPSRQERVDSHMATVPEVREVAYKGPTPEPPTPEVQETVEANPDAFLHPLGNAPDESAWEISSPVGMRMHPVRRRRELHEGTDFSASIGTPLKAMQHGKVIRNWEASGGGGHSIVIEYGNGAQVTYMHMDAASSLVRGAIVTPGQVVGATGTAGTGPHLHAELRFPPYHKKNDVHDLEKFLKASAGGTLDTTDTKFYKPEDRVLNKFDGATKAEKEAAYRTWRNALPRASRPRNWGSALAMLTTEDDDHPGHVDGDH